MAALTALRCDNAEALQLAIDKVETPQQSMELSDAFCWVDFDAVKAPLEPLVHHENALIRVAAVVSGGFFTDTLNKKVMQRCLNDESPKVVVAT